MCNLPFVKNFSPGQDLLSRVQSKFFLEKFKPLTASLPGCCAADIKGVSLVIRTGRRRNNYIKERKIMYQRTQMIDKAIEKMRTSAEAVDSPIAKMLSQQIIDNIKTDSIAEKVLAEGKTLAGWNMLPKIRTAESL